jgi:hypothetical protein
VQQTAAPAAHGHPSAPAPNPPSSGPTCGAEGGDVLGRTLASVLEIVVTDARWMLAHGTQHIELEEQMH